METVFSGIRSKQTQFRDCFFTRGANKLVDKNHKTEAGRTIAIGDIHGHADALRRLLDEIQPELRDTIVPLGDYVNRGLDSRGVIEALIELSEHCRVFPILGGSSGNLVADRLKHVDFVFWGDERSQYPLPTTSWTWRRLESC